MKRKIKTKKKKVVNKKSVAIIGAGLGGLVLGYRMLKKGYEVSIIERSDHVGGLAAGFPYLGTSLEQTYHHIFRTDTDIQDLVKELGIADTLVWRDSSVSILFGGKNQSFRGPGDLLKFEGLSVIDKLRVGASAALLSKDPGWRKYIGIPAYKFMRLFSGENGYNTIWGPLLKNKFHQYYDKVSMAWLWARVYIRANSGEKGKEKLGYFKGGFAVIIDELVKQIKAMGGKIELNAKVDSERFSKLRGNFGKVVFTGPNGAFAEIIKQEEDTEPEYLFKLKQIDYLGAICVIFSSKKSLSKFYWHNVNEANAPFLAFIEHTNFVPKEWYKGENVYYMGGYYPHEHENFKISEEELTKKWLLGLSKLFPEFKQKDAENVRVFRFKNAQHVVTCDYEKWKPEVKTPLKNVYLMNFAQLFPEDRGTNFSVRDANKLAEILSKN